jgi:hypothetical protein
MAGDGDDRMGAHALDALSGDTTTQQSTPDADQSEMGDSMSSWGTQAKRHLSISLNFMFF